MKQLQKILYLCGLQPMVAKVQAGLGRDFSLNLVCFGTEQNRK